MILSLLLVLCVWPALWRAQLTLAPTQGIICDVCYASPCNASNATSPSLLFCALVNTTQCGACATNCLQCLNNASGYVCHCPGTPPSTVAPTARPTTETPTVVNATRRPTPVITQAPTVFRECLFCNGSSPPPSLPCPGSTEVQMLCENEASNSSSCAPCPTFCPFCFPLLAPTPQYVCTCPPTEAPTLAPTTRAPTGKPTLVPTTVAPTHFNEPVWATAFLWVFLIGLGVLLLMVFLACAIVNIPAFAHRHRGPQTQQMKEFYHNS
jgi:hypothetical protein